MLILRRFDRIDEGHRVGYISAMTALGASDGDHRDYAEIAEAIRDLSLSPRADHHELFDRVVASVGLGNTDDHLCNHGLLADRGSWTLSPAFDVNPNPDPWQTRSTSIMGADGSNGIRLREVAMMADSIEPRLEAVTHASRKA